MRKVTCSRCDGLNERAPAYRYCLSCHAAYMREHRPKHSELKPEQRRKANSRTMANVYQKRGKIVPRPCEACSSNDAQKHHDDYSKPLIVRWLCRSCHLKLHREAA
jgi:hypothetical protein